LLEGVKHGHSKPEEGEVEHPAENPGMVSVVPRGRRSVSEHPLEGPICMPPHRPVRPPYMDQNNEAPTCRAPVLQETRLAYAKAEARPTILLQRIAPDACDHIVPLHTVVLVQVDPTLWPRIHPSQAIAVLLLEVELRLACML